VALQPFVGPWPSFQFLNLYTAGRTPWTVEKHKQNKRIQTSIIRVGFESKTPVLERTKTFHASDRAANNLRSRAAISVVYLKFYDLPLFLTNVYKMNDT
jgi:hypothetical protein